MKLKLVNAPTYISKDIKLRKGDEVEIKDVEVAQRMLKTGLFEAVKEKAVRKGEKKE